MTNTTATSNSLINSTHRSAHKGRCLLALVNSPMSAISNMLSLPRIFIHTCALSDSRRWLWSHFHVGKVAMCGRAGWNTWCNSNNPSFTLSKLIRSPNC
eukprot:5172306-Amphidinium_carterae.1